METPALLRKCPAGGQVGGDQNFAKRKTRGQGEVCERSNGGFCLPVKKPNRDAHKCRKVFRTENEEHPVNSDGSKFWASDLSCQSPKRHLIWTYERLGTNARSITASGYREMPSLGYNETSGFARRLPIRLANWIPAVLIRSPYRSGAKGCFGRRSTLRLRVESG